PCGVDTYSDNEGTSPCTACPAGLIVDKAGSDSVDLCAAPVLTTAATCIPGTSFDQITETCRMCGIGTFQGLPGQTSCRSCP
ncbi:hypothetical protein T484DRAFT_1555862, partial [Baffinella frigidus]